ncbi:hypothetical protein Micbo1qcDRAFT_208433 [Microdochium bolleyi]|uniref:F-box domain-containing protein n=1 Tax=Microdochium bolleyi TaxID=196109 RepID=A0A136IQ49_9PEZI|nr:hypothetical protein Micbo1qcDRAFT_208433 [Microdochium bolleyi]
MTPNDQASDTVSSAGSGEAPTSATTPPPTTLTDLPLEMILNIAENLPQAALANLLQTCRSFYEAKVLQSLLYRRDMPGHAVYWACKHGDEGQLQRALDHGARVNDYLAGGAVTFGSTWWFTPSFVQPLLVMMVYGHFTLAAKLIRQHHVDPCSPKLTCCLPQPLANFDKDRVTSPSFALYALLKIMARVGISPDHNELLSDSQLAGANDLFDVMFESYKHLRPKNMRPYGRDMYSEPLLVLASYSRVPSSWFKRLLRFLPSYAIMQSDPSNDLLPWESLILDTLEDLSKVLVWSSRPVVGWEPRELQPIKDNFCDKLAAIVAHYDVNNLVDECARWMMHYMAEKLTNVTDTPLALRAFGILLSAPGLDPNHVGNIWVEPVNKNSGDTKLHARTLLQHLAWMLWRAHQRYIEDGDGVRLRAYQRKGVKMLTMLLQRGAGPVVAAQQAARQGELPPILLLASCGHQCVKEPLAVILTCHRTALAGLQLARLSVRDDDDGNRDGKDSEHIQTTIRTPAGNNALHLACESPIVNPDVIKLLVKHGGIDATQRNNVGHTPLHKLCGSERRDEVSVAAAKALMARVDDRGKRDVLANSDRGVLKPVEIASLKGKAELVCWLQGLEYDLFR